MYRCCHGNALFAMKQEAVFEGLGMLENSQNLAHTSEGVKIEIWYRSQDLVWQNGSVARPTKFQRSSPCCTFHRDVWNLVGRCNIPNFNKHLLENSSDQVQIWSVQSKVLQDERLHYLWVFVERRSLLTKGNDSIFCHQQALCFHKLLLSYHFRVVSTRVREPVDR